MDLGATVCTPKAPNCGICPLTEECAARREGAPERYPVKPAKAEKPVRYGSAYVLRRGETVWLVRRPPSGLLGGMLGLPGTVWREERGAARAPLAADWAHLGEVRHVFTHFALRLDVFEARVSRVKLPEGYWAEAEELAGLPTVFAKAAALAGLSVRRRR
jgi:A/G-specific adenine glycosylase